MQSAGKPGEAAAKLLVSSAGKVYLLEQYQVDEIYLFGDKCQRRVNVVIAQPDIRVYTKLGGGWVARPAERRPSPGGADCLPGPSRPGIPADQLPGHGRQSN